jgi:alpha-N-arabinofuranosidase
VPYLDIAGVLDEDGKVVTFFAVNRHPSKTLSAGLSLQGFGAAARVIDHQVITHPDLHVVNSLERPNEVSPRPGQGATVEDGVVRVDLPPHSWQMIRVSV